MSEIVVVGAFRAREGREQDALELFTGLLAPTHAESGCLLYSLHRGADDPARLVFIERWASREDLDAHLASDHIKAALSRAEELFGDNAEITVYDPAPGGAPAKGSLAGQAAGSGAE